MKGKRTTQSTNRCESSLGWAQQFLIVSTVLAWGLVASGEATTWTVCPGVGCDFNDIQTAVTAASSGDELSIEAGTYLTPFLSPINIGKSLTLAGAGAATTTIQGNGAGVIGSAAPFTVNISGLTITGGVAPANGGGIHNSAQLTLTDVVIEGNTAVQDGGGIFTEGRITMEYVEIRSNFADLGGLEALGNPRGRGGGIWSSNNLTITDSTIEDNEALQGGGIFSQDDVYLDYSQVVNNRAVDNTGSATRIAGGGGIYKSGAGGGNHDLIINFSSISGNSAVDPSASLIDPVDGGGIYSESDTVLNYSLLSRNSTDHLGCGLALAGGRPGVLNGVTVTGNEGTGFFTSSAIYFSSSNTLELNNVTVTDNPAGVFSESGSGGVDIRNSILADNGALSCSGLGAISSLDYNIDSGTSCGFTEASDLQNTDPQLHSLVDAGGPTKTHPTLWGSPAIDGADPVSGCRGRLTNTFGALVGLETDQRGQVYLDVPLIGNAAPADEVCDIGAYEYNLLLEAGFEGSSAGRWWKGRRLRAGDRKICPDALDPNQAHSGRCYARLLGNGNQKAVYQRLNRSGSSGDSHTLIVWSATSAASAGGTLEARVVLEHQQGNGSDQASCPITVAQHGWEKCEVSITATANYNKVFATVISTLGSGAVAIDDVGLVPHGP